MALGMTQGFGGPDVSELQRILRFAGQAIEPDELARATFGPSTFAALRALQARRGLGVTGVVDRETLPVLLEIERSIAGGVGNEPPPPPMPSPPPPPSPPPGDARATVRGTLVDPDGNGIANTRVAVFQPMLRVPAQLVPGAESVTDTAGAYTIVYDLPSAANLLVRAFDARGRQIAEAQFVSHVGAPVSLTTASDGVVRPLSTLARLKHDAQSVLRDVPLSSLIENKDVHEVTFLARSIDAPFKDVARLVIATRLAAQCALRDETLFGLFSQGIPTPLNAALDDLPDAGIDGTFLNNILNGVILVARDTLDRTLQRAVSNNVLPGSIPSPATWSFRAWTS